jgi:hypothetical protein
MRACQTPSATFPGTLLPGTKEADESGTEDGDLVTADIAAELIQSPL